MKKGYIWAIVIILVAAAVWVAGMQRSEPIVDNTPVAENKEQPVLGEEAKEFIVEGKNFSFMPNNMTVQKGDKVRVVFKSTEGFHDFVIDGYGVATAQLRAPAEEVLEFTADKAGTFEYYCSVGTHRAMGMTGTFIVEE